VVGIELGVMTEKLEKEERRILVLQPTYFFDSEISLAPFLLFSLISSSSNVSSYPP